MWKGDPGDKMYISIKGRMGIYLGVTQEVLTSQPIAIVPEYTALGEKALKNDDDVRTATVMCLDGGMTECLTLDKESYQSLVNRSILIAKGFRYAFLIQYYDELFATWTKTKILDLNENFIEQFQCQQFQLVYDMGQPAEVVYFLREGTATMESILEYEKNIKYPIDAQKWEIKRTTKTLVYQVRKLKKGDYFGHEEVLSVIHKRQTRVKCDSACKILYINKSDLLKQFWAKTLETMKQKHCHLIQLSTIESAIKKVYKLKSKQNKALLDATKLNPVNLHSLHRTAENHDNEMNTRIGRLVPWLHNAKINKTNNVSIINELKKIEVIDVHKEKIYRDRAHLITQEQIDEFDEMLRTKVRFATNHGVLINHLVVEGNERLLRANTIKA